ncbi:MAG TPA: hypothetical protein VHB48_00680 [Chitinophagaceae bacterium]|nr:hypothetical protein [Chitinophagaceae bacterium]
MKIWSTLLTAAMLYFPVISFCQSKQIYEAPSYKDVLHTHKTVAILPLTVTISFKKFPKNYNAEDNAKQEREEGLNMQQGMYTFLLRKSSDYYVTFQDVQRTNILLKQAGVFEKLDSITADSICKILKVDGVIQATYAYEKTGSEAGAIAKTVLFGFGGSTGSGALTMQINNGTDGNLLWRFYKEMNEGVFSSANELMERMMRKVARNFPYEK